MVGVAECSETGTYKLFLDREYLTERVAGILQVRRVRPAPLSTLTATAALWGVTQCATSSCYSQPTAQCPILSEQTGREFGFLLRSPGLSSIMCVSFWTAPPPMSSGYSRSGCERLQQVYLSIADGEVSWLRNLVLCLINHCTVSSSLSMKGLNKQKTTHTHTHIHTHTHTLSSPTAQVHLRWASDLSAEREHAESDGSAEEDLGGGENNERDISPYISVAVGPAAGVTTVAEKSKHAQWRETFFLNVRQAPCCAPSFSRKGRSRV